MLAEIYTLVFICCLGRHCYTDVREMLLYDSTNAVLALAGLLRAVYLSQTIEALQGAFCLGLLMLLLYFCARGGMGEGDVKLAVVLGLWLGVEQGLACLLLAFVSGALYSGVVLAWSRGSCRRALPFGPFLCGSACVCYWWGWQLITWYWQLLS